MWKALLEILVVLLFVYLIAKAIWIPIWLRSTQDKTNELDNPIEQMELR